MQAFKNDQRFETLPQTKSDYCWYSGNVQNANEPFVFTQFVTFMSNDDLS